MGDLHSGFDFRSTQPSIPLDHVASGSAGDDYQRVPAPNANILEPGGRRRNRDPASFVWKYEYFTRGLRH